MKFRGYTVKPWDLVRTGESHCQNNVCQRVQRWKLWECGGQELPMLEIVGKSKTLSVNLVIFMI